MREASALVFIDAAEVRRRLPPDRAVEAVAQAYVALARSAVEAPLRTVLTPRAGSATSLVMTARGTVRCGDEEGAFLAVKVVSVAPDNRDRGLPTTPATVLLLDARDGRALAALDGTTLTAVRTGAASGAATRALARPDARVLAMIGAGGQAWDQVASVVAVRPIREVWVYSPTAGRARALCDRLNADFRDRGLTARVADSADDAVSRADVVCCATSSRTPVFAAGSVRPGTHVNGVGSYRPDMVELPPALLAGPVFVESREIVEEESGEVLAALAAGRLKEDALVAIGDVLDGRRAGRRGPDDITVFKSCGTAAQDLYAAAWAFMSGDAARRGGG